MSWYRILIISLAAIAQGGKALLACDSTAEDRHRWESKALERLGKDFHIIEGELSFHKGGNPQGKYGIVTLPDHAMPPILARAQPQVGAFPIPLNISFVMGPQDAIVWLGCTPPLARYFSLRSYLAFRFGKDGEDLTSVSGYMPAAELSDPLNNELIKTTGGVGNPFSKTTLVMSTGDNAVYRHVKQSFMMAGFPESAINLDALPADKIRFRDHRRPWITELSDTIAWHLRVNEILDGKLASEYFNSRWPVFLLRPKVAQPSSRRFHTNPEPIISPALRERGTGNGEEWLRPTLERLIDTMETRMKESDFQLTYQLQLSPLIPDTDRCMKERSYCPIAKPVLEWNQTLCIPTCDWFSRDSLYSLPGDGVNYRNMIFPKDRVLVLVGVNHVLTAKASFTNLLVTDVAYPEMPGHTPNFSSAQLGGSGSYHLPNEPNAPLLYAQILSRNCAGMAFCELVSEESIGYNHEIFFGERAYLERATTIGPSEKEIISPFVLMFDPARPSLRSRNPPARTSPDQVPVPPIGLSGHRRQKWDLSLNVQPDDLEEINAAIS